MLRVVDEIKKTLAEYDRKKGGHKKLMSYVTSYPDNNDIKALRALQINIGEKENLNAIQWKMLFQLLKERSKNQKHTSFKELNKLERTLFGKAAEKVVNYDNPSQLASIFVLLSKHDLLAAKNCAVIARAKNPKIAYEVLIDRAKNPQISYEKIKKDLRGSDSESSSEVSRASEYESTSMLSEKSGSESSLGFSSSSSEESSNEESTKKSSRKANNDVMCRDLLKVLRLRHQLTDENRAIVMAEKNPIVLWAFKILIEGNVFTPEKIKSIKSAEHPIDLAKSIRAQRLLGLFEEPREVNNDELPTRKNPTPKL
jgi:hypothetical protein